MKKHFVMMDTRKEDIQMGALVFRTKNMGDKTRLHQMEVFMKGYKQACDSINHFGVTHYKEILKKYYGLTPQAINALPDSLKFTYQAPRQKDIDCAKRWLEKKKK
jgi:NitT/TauT family transport system substrate-binding protein